MLINYWILKACFETKPDIDFYRNVIVVMNHQQMETWERNRIDEDSSITLHWLVLSNDNSGPVCGTQAISKKSKSQHTAEIGGFTDS